MQELKRTKVGNFRINDAITINELKEKFEKNDYSNIITIERIFKDIPAINLNENNIKQYLNGVKISTMEKCKESDSTQELKKENDEKINTEAQENLEDGIYRIYYKNEFNGIGIVKDGKLKRDLVIENEMNNKNI